MSDPNMCWHCHIALAPLPRPHCKNCLDECDVEGCTEPGCAAAVPEAPALPEGWETIGDGANLTFCDNHGCGKNIRLDFICALLASQGLSIIKSDDPRLGFLDVNDMAEWLGAPERDLGIIGPKDRAVLEAGAAIALVILHEWTAADQGPGINSIAEAELARREGK